MWVNNISNPDIPLDAWGGAPTLSESVKEQFSDTIKKSQKAAKQQKILEQKAKKYDDTLANIIKSMLVWWDNDFLVVLISDLIDKNVPSDFILSLLSLISDEALERVNLRLSEWNIYEFTKWSWGIIPFSDDELWTKILSWINLIYSIAIIEKEWVLASIIDHNSWKSISSLNKLFLVILTSEMKKHWVEAWRKEELFSESIFDLIVEKLQWEMY